MTRMPSLLKPFLCLCLLAPMPAFAFQSDTTNILMLAISLGGFCFFNLLLTGLFYFTGQYHSRRFAKIHTLISLLPALLTFILAITYIEGAGAISLNIGVIIVSIALSILPVQLSPTANAPTDKTPLILATVALLLMVVAYYAAPLTIFALAIAHVAASSRGTLSVKLLSYATLITGYSYLGYWAYQIALHS
ncbi:MULTISPECIES: hypothetical protein [unclassified Shewanella]|uniref:hypothetical protein n=1 Tax=unclassified Shewanella TaxID=196818 RepID=UPI000C7CE972|nr:MULTISPECIES: hypothetical protein [unclassified Shewanella]PKG58810.1 hypothetical protein CXF82_02575 [Shewanella sp. GutDb-MelDb]PKG73539.1 hypothetical protein CXF86_17700 [Shewanella sp. GutCb]